MNKSLLFFKQSLQLIELGQVKDFEVHSDLKKYDASEYKDTKVISTTHSLFYVNADIFRHQLVAICPLKDTIVEKTVCQHVNLYIFIAFRALFLVVLA